MSAKKMLTKGVFFLSFLFFKVAVLSSYGQKSQIYSPQDLPAPVLDPTGFIIDPGKKIVDEWKQEMIDSRETYFFSRYVEPICVRVDNIKSPENIESYADELVRLWDLEKKTNGRFVLQVACKSKKKIVYRIGSRLKDFYPKSFLNDLAADIESVHFSGDATGTGDFVSLQKLGDRIFYQLAFDSKIRVYEGNNGIHSYYPDKVEKSNGDLTVMKKSLYQASVPAVISETNDTPNTVNEVSSADIAKSYFEGLSTAEINSNYSAINTSGVISNVNDVPNARKIDNGHVTDPHNLLSKSAIETINNYLNQLEDSLGYQVAVVCLNSIGDNDTRVWGTELFNLWGVGEKETENGLLMLLVNDQHAIDFITGRGTEGILTDVDCYNIQQEEMVPHFKNNDYVTGMIRGTQAVCDFFFGEPPIYSSASDSDYEASEYYYEDAAYSSSSFFESGFFIFYAVAAVLFSGIWVVFLICSLFISDLHTRYHVLKFFSLTLWAILFPIPFILIYFFTRSLMNRWRNTVRFSKTTGEFMHKLGDHEEDKHLNRGQISEEKIKSIDYDVWISPGGKEVLILAYKRWFSKYRKCPSCKYKTYFKAYDRTITSATEYSTGTGERMHKCENCGHSKVERYTISKLSKSNSSSGYSSSGSSYSSGSSSGGSSYGGGSSRGGGSGSKW